jgi:hypothetical protein
MESTCAIHAILDLKSIGKDITKLKVIEITTITANILIETKQQVELFNFVCSWIHHYFLWQHQVDCP